MAPSSSAWWRRYPPSACTPSSARGLRGLGFVGGARCGLLRRVFVGRAPASRGVLLVGATRYAFAEEAGDAEALGYRPDEAMASFAADGGEVGAFPPPFGVAMRQGPRDAMEDACSVVPKARCGYFFASVFDGHGGAAAAQILARSLYAAFSQAIDEDPRRVVSPLPRASSQASGGDGAPACPVHLTPPLTLAFQQADAELISQLAQMPDPECYAGTTATSVLVRRDRVVCANVGDSRAVLCRGGKAVDLSKEHRVSGSGATAADEKARVNEAGGWVAEGRVCGILAVSRAFGGFEFKDGRFQLKIDLMMDGDRRAKEATMDAPVVVPTPDVMEVERVGSEQVLIIATDGLWDVVSSKDACREALKVLEAAPPGVSACGEAAQQLVDLALKRRTQDNVTVMVCDLRQKE